MAFKSDSPSPLRLGLWVAPFLHNLSNYLGAIAVLLLVGGLVAAYQGEAISGRLIAGTLVVIEVALVLSLLAGLQWRNHHRRPSRMLLVFNIIFLLVTTAALLADHRGWLGELSNTIRLKIADAAKPPVSKSHAYTNR
jgi:hypothetical protein